MVHAGARVTAGRRLLAQPGSECAVARLPGADSPDLVQRCDENLAVADLARLCALDNGFHGALDPVVRNGNLYLCYWQKIDNVLCTAKQLGVSEKTSESLDITDCHTLDSDFSQRVTHDVEAKLFYYLGDKFHIVSL